MPSQGLNTLSRIFGKITVSNQILRLLGINSKYGYYCD
jgi:hypothetical protein